MNELQERYLNLLKKTLIDYNSIGFIEHKPITNKSFKYLPFNILNKILKLKKFIIAKQIKFSKDEIINGKVWPFRADTMIGLKRLDNIQHCVLDILKNNIDGDFIETGVWRGGGSIFMKAILSVFNINNKIVWVADSFEGLPKPNKEKYIEDINDTLYKYKELKVSLQEVKDNFKKYDLLDNNVKFLKGWFSETLPKAPMQKLSLLRLDGDMYESTWDALVNLYPKLSIGGFIIIDDWNAVKGCKKAVEDYRLTNNITEKIVTIDWASVFWKKER